MAATSKRVAWSSQRHSFEGSPDADSPLHIGLSGDSDSGDLGEPTAGGYRSLRAGKKSRPGPVVAERDNHVYESIGG